MLLKDDTDKAEEEHALLERSSSFDSQSNPFSDGAEAVAASSSSMHTLSSPPTYYPPLPSTFPPPARSDIDTSPPAPHSAHVSWNLEQGNLALSHVLNLNVAMPPLLALPQAHFSTDRKKKEDCNGYFRSAMGRVDLRLGFVGREQTSENGSQTDLPLVSHRDRIKVFVSSRERMKIVCMSRTPGLPISLSIACLSSVTLVLPRDFRGPVHLVQACRSKVTFSPQAQQAFTHISSSPPIAFLGSIAGWSGASPTEEDKATVGAGGVKEVRLDELWVNMENRNERINISFAGDAEEDERAGRESSGRGGGAKKSRRRGFWSCCCSCSNGDFDM